MRTQRLTIMILLAALLGLSLYVYTMPLGQYQDAIINIVFLVAPLVSVIAGIFAVRAYGMDNIHGNALLYITLGLASWFVGEAIWAIYELILRISPYPSIADLFYLAAYPLIFIGILREIMNYKTDVNPVRSLVISTISIALSIMVFNIAILPSYSNGSTFLENAIAISYGLGDVMLIVGISYILMLTMDFRGGKLFYVWLHIIIAVIFMLLGDLFFAIYREQYEQSILAYKRIDLFWILSYIAFAMGLFEIHFMIRNIQNKIRQLLD